MVVAHLEVPVVGGWSANNIVVGFASITAAAGFTDFCNFNTFHNV
jgi:hypothetical protein